jgi:hypothetical protein
VKTLVSSFRFQETLARGAKSRPPFYRMPPVSYRRFTDDFSPDYALLLLCDSLIMDAESFETLTKEPAPGFEEVAEAFKALHADRRVELRDFSAELKPHRRLLKRMLQHDLKRFDQWILPLRDSLDLWGHFARVASTMLRDQLIREYQGDESHADSFMSHMSLDDYSRVNDFSGLIADATTSLNSSRRRESRNLLRQVLRGYLTYVNANVILADQLDASLHDWQDLTPLYANKFLSVGNAPNSAQQGAQQLGRMFEVSFPDLAIESPRELIRALNDKRIEDLRTLVSQALSGQTQFDEAFAASVLREVFRNCEQAKRWRHIVGYATLPVHLIPWVGAVAQKILEEVLGVVIDRRLRREHRWFYLLSDIAEHRR